ncbi:hypothetical protein ACLI09_04690 [Flavobacterium sp. RHBU_24]|uniref:hypothetical protein n=1 Tax=Flavobacterium sp. RHBU_24 TaxID=3391185 RepID=UPI0039856942
MNINFSKPSGPLLGLMCIIVFLAVGLIILSLFQDYPAIGTYGVNKTVGWAWDICNLLPVAVITFIIIFILGYLIMLLFKARVNKIVSMVNLVLLIVPLSFLFINKFDMNCFIFLGIGLLSVLMVFVNIGFAIANSMHSKRNTVL